MKQEKSTIESRIKAFFTAYEKRYADALAGSIDVEATAAAFAEEFIEANPFGVHAGRNDEELRKVIPKGMEFYREIGTKSMEVGNLSITTLDPLHYLAKVHWRATYRQKDKDDLLIEFDVIYFLQDIGQKLKIFAYITGDERGVMKEHGLID
ncbi:hypothetical protein [Pseudobacter ginsenosidimutans]|uniref:SnoaL-like protein n=1 Tax=Pseudobacter ginsenosidimutans TaxID=661488 RepID=A0A4Q7N429_9BACT|nr:hypothetical protein [Pseudobacter ginsenosidimutans]QEC44280.1 hypothetical protein FSB84_22345 [Pseudobacter ginsenosidimutans]RZS75741.1 hypothetical protein EV199_1614 [Pseudobacter ginsenosidimutans]